MTVDEFNKEIVRFGHAFTSRGPWDKLMDILVDTYKDKLDKSNNTPMLSVRGFSETLMDYGTECLLSGVPSLDENPFEEVDRLQAELVEAYKQVSKEQS